MSSCIVRCVGNVVEKYCHCMPLLPVDATSQNIPQNHNLQFCTADHFINCEENEVETKKCLNEQCPINCDEHMYELVPARAVNDLFAEAIYLQLQDVIYLQLMVQENFRYPVYTEVYTQTWESFLGELGELRDTLQYNRS